MLPAVWDEAYAYGMPRTDTAPDPGMPSGWTNKAHGNTLYAHLADMKSMWREVDLTKKERRAVFMRYMLDFTMPEIAEHEISDKGTIHTRLYVAIGKIVAHLNGTEFAEGEVAA